MTEYKKIYFGFDHYELSQEPKIKEILTTKLRGFQDDIYPNDNDFLPLEGPDDYRVVHPFHNIRTMMYELDHPYIVESKSTDWLIDNNVPFIYPIGTAGGPWDWTQKLVIKSSKGVTEEESPRRYLFKFIKEKTKQAIRDKKGYIVLDMSFEGFPIVQTHKKTTEFLSFNLINSLYLACERENIPPEQVVFCHGNLLAEKQLTEFNKKNNITNPIKTLECIWYETQIKNRVENQVKESEVQSLNLKIPHGYNWRRPKEGIMKIAEKRFEENFNYKVQNLESMKKFQCLVRRPKTVRAFTMLGLNYYDLLKHGECSFSLKFSFLDSDHIGDLDDNRKLRPEGLDGRHYNGDAPGPEDAKLLLDKDLSGKIAPNYLYRHTRMFGSSENIRSMENINNFVDKLPLKYDTYDLAEIDSLTYQNNQYNNTFFSVLPETWYDDMNIVFFSEKIFKTVGGFHPFTLISNPNSLKYFEKLGYKNFDFGVDFDSIKSPVRRIQKIFPIVQNLCSLSNKELLDWYSNQSDILIHNYYTLMSQERVRENARTLLNLYEGISG